MHSLQDNKYSIRYDFLMLRNDKVNLQVWFIKFYDMENDMNYLTYNMKGFKLHKLSVDTTNKGLVDTLKR